VRLGEDHRRDTCLIESRVIHFSSTKTSFGQELLLLHAKLSMFGKFSVHVSFMGWCEGLGEEHSISVLLGTKSILGTSMEIGREPSSFKPLHLFQACNINLPIHGR
jgi:hypothetical protein